MRISQINKKPNRFRECDPLIAEATSSLLVLTSTRMVNAERDMVNCVQSWRLCRNTEGTISHFKPTFGDKTQPEIYFEEYDHEFGDSFIGLVSGTLRRPYSQTSF
ncbi:hypothetical protein BgiMline_005486 [Biomphalaria glabrata]|nr:hypothetical protein BgiMline_003526 [Biomphalaria glabrata]